MAFAGPDLNSLTQSTVSLLKASGRTIKSINIISTFGTGRPAGVRIVHTEAAPVPPSCRVAQQSFAVNFLTNFFVRANETLGYLKMANKQVIDFQYTSFFGTGKPAAGQFLYCL